MKRAIEALTPELVSSFLVNSVNTLKAWGIPEPRSPSAASTPTPGDNGVLGTEEQDILLPAIQMAQAVSSSIDGPIPADSIFMKGYDGTYDAVIALFHDTANIAIKLMDERYPSVVITAGLPFIRTTVAHGTAYDIAYRGIASHAKMLNCILAAAEIGGRLRERN